MACPTCDHTMLALGCMVTKENFYVCMRCGTIKPCGGSGDLDVDVVPALVKRCRQFEELMFDRELPEDHHVEWLREKWHSLGIGESINVPADRPAAPVR